MPKITLSGVDRALRDVTTSPDFTDHDRTRWIDILLDRRLRITSAKATRRRRDPRKKAAAT